MSLRPPPAPPPPPQRLPAPTAGPAKSWYFIAAALFVLLFVPSLIAFLNGFGGITNGLIRIPVPGERAVDLEAGKWTVFYEHTGEFDGATYLTSKQAPRLSIVVTDADGHSVPVARSSSTFNYNVGGRAGYSIAEFRTQHDGTYRIVATVVDRDESESYLIALGRNLGKATALFVLGLLGMLAAAGVAFIAWLVVFILRYVARRRAA